MSTPMTNPTDLLARLDERQKALMDKLDDIHEEVKKTNGRVRSLEEWRSELRGSWKATIFLSSAVGAVIGAIGSFIFN